MTEGNLDRALQVMSQVLAALENEEEEKKLEQLNRWLESWERGTLSATSLTSAGESAGFSVRSTLCFSVMVFFYVFHRAQ